MGVKFIGALKGVGTGKPFYHFKDFPTFHTHCWDQP